MRYRGTGTAPTDVLFLFCLFCMFFSLQQYEFDYASLFSLFLIYFPMACWCAGSAVSAGLVVPILIIGASFGRICGLMLVDLTGTLYMTTEWNWIDPGAFALIGAAAFFGGVSRLTISLTVIVSVEGCMSCCVCLLSNFSTSPLVIPHHYCTTTTTTTTTTKDDGNNK